MLFSLGIVRSVDIIKGLSENCLKCSKVVLGVCRPISSGSTNLLLGPGLLFSPNPPQSSLYPLYNFSIFFFKILVVSKLVAIHKTVVPFLTELYCFHRNTSIR